MKTQGFLSNQIKKGLIPISFLLLMLSYSKAQHRPDFEDITICRIQVKLTTANKDNAGTDIPLYVQLNSGDQRFYLDHGGNDYKRNSSRSYDILSKNVNKLSDIQFLKLGIKNKKDGWIGAKVELHVNGYKVFEKRFSNGVVLKGDNKYPKKEIVFSRNELRNSNYWRYTSANRDMWKAPRFIPHNMMVDVIEAGIGHIIKGGNFAWDDEMKGAAYVEMKYSTPTTLRVDLDLRYKLAARPDPDVDVDFDLVFSCENGKLAVKTENIVVKVDKINQLLGVTLNELKEKAKKAAQALAEETYPGSGKIVGFLGELFDYDFNVEIKMENPNIHTSGTHACNSVEVTPNGNIRIIHDEG